MKAACTGSVELSKCPSIATCHKAKQYTCATIQLNTFPALASMVKTHEIGRIIIATPQQKKRKKNNQTASSVTAAPLSLATVARPAFPFLGHVCAPRSDVQNKIKGIQ